jgi:Dehydrogenases with different specificities (related to short-chain alcohol dehydrogenases)
MFKGKTAVFTGAGSGIGAATCKAFAKNGANVVAIDLVKENVDKTVEDIRLAGGNAIGCCLDVTDKKAVNLAAEKIFEKFKTIDIWMNCAGISRIIPTLECSEDIWNLTLDVNLKGMFFCCQAAINYMHSQKSGGVIINLSSQSGKKAGGQYAAYCSSKFGVIGLTQSLAVEFAKEGIRVNAICPGVVETPMWDKQKADYAKKRNIKPEEVMQYFCDTIPLGRLGTYEDVSELAMFLAGEKSSYITGQAINLAGGSIMF